MAETKADAATLAAIIAALETGAGPIAAAKAGGIHPSTFFDWSKRADISERIKKARDTGRAKMREDYLQTINRAATGFKAPDGQIVLPTWQAAAWALERMYKAEFARQDNIEHGGEIKTTRRVLFDEVAGSMTNEQRAEFCEMMIERLGKPPEPDAMPIEGTNQAGAVSPARASVGICATCRFSMDCAASGAGVSSCGRWEQKDG